MKENKKKSMVDTGFKFYKGMNKYELEDGTTFWATNHKEAQKYKNHIKKVKGE